MDVLERRSWHGRLWSRVRRQPSLSASLLLPLSPADTALEQAVHAIHRHKQRGMQKKRDRSGGPLTNILVHLLSRWSRGQSKTIPMECSVHMDNAWTDLVTTHHVCVDASVQFDDPLSLHVLQLSSGTLRATNIRMDWWKVVTNQFQTLQPFWVHADRVQLTSANLMASPGIRHGLRRLLQRYIVADSMASLRIDDIRIRSEGIVVVDGTATTILGQRWPFAIEAEVSVDTSHSLTLNTKLSTLGFPQTPLRLDLGPCLDIQELELMDNAVVVTGSLELGNAMMAYQGLSDHVFVNVGTWLSRRIGLLD